MNQRRPYQNSVDIKTVITHLQRDVASLVPELLPAGVREGAEWCVGSLDGEKGRSCKVHMQAGDKAGVWSDFAAGVGGDIFDLVTLVKFGGDKKETMRWAVARYGLARSGTGTSGGAKDRGPVGRGKPQGSGASAHQSSQPIRRDQKIENRAKAIFFKDCQKALRGTLTDRYLKGRGIDLAVLAKLRGKAPSCIRHAEGIWCSEVNRRLPALVACVNGPAMEWGGGFTIHRHYLAALPSGKVVKADLKAPKKLYSSCKGGAIRVWRGKSGLPIDKAPWGDKVLITEGLEDALVAAIARPDLRVLAAVSLANIPNLALPEAIRTVYIAADNEGNDKAEEMASRALGRAVARFQDKEERRVLIVRSSAGKDLNDRLMEV